MYMFAPDYSQDLTELYSSGTVLKSFGNKLTLPVPKVRIHCWESTFKYHYAVEWNALPFHNFSIVRFYLFIKSYIFHLTLLLIHHIGFLFSYQFTYLILISYVVLLLKLLIHS